MAALKRKPRTKIVLYTPPLAIFWMRGQVLQGRIANVSNKKRSIKIQIIDSDGVNVVTPHERVLNPGQTASLSAEAPGFGGDTEPAYCKFTVEGTKRNFRASAMVVDQNVENPDLGPPGIRAAISAE